MFVHSILFLSILTLGYVNDLLHESLNNNDSRSLRVAFLVIRQISLEGGHVFQPYITWFQVSVRC